MTFLKEHWAPLILVAFVMVWFVAVFVATPHLDLGWFEKPLKDATVGDAFVLLCIYLVLRK